MIAIPCNYMHCGVVSRLYTKSSLCVHGGLSNPITSQIDSTLENKSLKYRMYDSIMTHC